eukprot:gene31854-31567_t
MWAHALAACSALWAAAVDGGTTTTEGMHGNFNYANGSAYSTSAPLNGSLIVGEYGGPLWLLDCTVPQQGGGRCTAAPLTGSHKWEMLSPLPAAESVLAGDDDGKVLLVRVGCPRPAPADNAVTLIDVKKMGYTIPRHAVPCAGAVWVTFDNGVLRCPNCTACVIGACDEPARTACRLAAGGKGTGAPPGGFDHPKGMACDGDAVLLADMWNERIARVAGTGCAAPTPDSAPGAPALCNVTTFAQLSFMPYSIALRVPAADDAARRRWVVTDFEGGQLWELDGAGGHVREWATGLTAPWQVTTADGRVAVSEGHHGNAKRVSVFDNSSCDTPCDASVLWRVLWDGGVGGVAWLPTPSATCGQGVFFGVLAGTVFVVAVLVTIEFRYIKCFAAFQTAEEHAFFLCDLVLDYLNLKN